jgi:hypothetical protein
VIHELLEVLQVVPPLEEEGLCDEEEPRGDGQLVALRLQSLLGLVHGHLVLQEEEEEEEKQSESGPDCTLVCFKMIYLALF